MKNAASLIVFALVMTQFATAQENLGIANSNYAGTNGVYLNPSSIVDSKVFLDINLIGASAFMHNNYVYLAKEDFYFPRDINGNIPEPLDNINGRKKWGYIDVAAHAPAFTLSIGDHGFGFHADLRSITGLHHIPEPVAKFAYEGLNYSPQHLTEYDEKNFFGNSTSFAEFGLSYGFILKKFQKDLWAVGITGKYLVGIYDIGFEVDEAQFTVIDSSDMAIANFNGEYGYAAGWNSGKGFGVDLGFTYKKMLEDVTHYSPHTQRGGCTTADYQYKIGVSLLDVGRIKFRQNAIHQDYTNSSTYWENYDSTAVNSVGGTDTAISGQLENIESLATSNEYNTWLPGAVSVQYDYNIGKGFYLNSTLIQGFRFPEQRTAIRPGLVSVTPRYERKRLEVAVPVSLVNYQHPQFGLMLRLNNLVIGTDRLGTYLFNWDVYGADIYFNLKIPIFNNPFCGSRSKDKKNRGNRKRGKKNGGSAAECPAYGFGN